MIVWENKIDMELVNRLIYFLRENKFQHIQIIK